MAGQGLAASVVVDQVDEVLSDPIGVDEIGTRFGAVLDLLDAYPQQFHAEQPRMHEVLFAGAAGFRVLRLGSCLQRYAPSGTGVWSISMTDPRPILRTRQDRDLRSWGCPA